MNLLNPKLKLIILGCLLILVGTFCSRQSIARDWYLIGGNIHLQVNLDDRTLQLKESGKNIFIATITESAKKEQGIQLSLTMKAVGEPYKEKYKNLQNFIAWIYITEQGQMKFLLSSFSNKAYYFATTPIASMDRKILGRAMGETEYNELKKNLGENIFVKYQANVLSNYEGTVTSEEVLQNEKSGWRQWLRTKYSVPNTIYISRMEDYTKDMDFSTGFITKTAPEQWRINYTLVNKNQGTAIKDSVPIRAFLVNTGNLENKLEYAKYKRPRKMTIYFSSDYTGGLGSSLANFNYSSYSFEMPDVEEPYVVIFYNVMNTKAISVNVDSYYLGEKNEASLFDLVFFADSTPAP